MEKLAQVLKDRRKKMGYSQEYVAEKAGINQSSYSKVERGLHSPSIFYLEKIAGALDIALPILAWDLIKPKLYDIKVGVGVFHPETFPIWVKSVSRLRDGSGDLIVTYYGLAGIDFQFKIDKKGKLWGNDGKEITGEYTKYVNHEIGRYISKEMSSLIDSFEALNRMK